MAENKNTNTQNSHDANKKIIYEQFSWNGATTSKIVHGNTQQPQSPKDKNGK